MVDYFDRCVQGCRRALARFDVNPLSADGLFFTLPLHVDVRVGRGDGDDIRVGVIIIFIFIIIVGVLFVRVISYLQVISKNLRYASASVTQRTGQINQGQRTRKARQW